MIAELGIDAAQAVHALDELDARGELIKGRFTDSGETSKKNDIQQWLHKDVFRRIRAFVSCQGQKGRQTGRSERLSGVSA